MSKYYIHNGACGTEKAFKIIGSKWKPQIIHICHINEGATFTDLKKGLLSISDSTLSRQINKLVEDQMLSKKDENHALYILTQKATDILPAMQKMQILANECGYTASGSSSSVEYVGKLIGSKWKSRIIWILYNCNVIRFNALLNSIEGLSHKILIEQLNDLINHDFVLRTDYFEKNPKVEYRLTKKGQNAYEIILSLADWCLKYEMIKPEISINY